MVWIINAILNQAAIAGGLRQESSGAFTVVLIVAGLGLVLQTHSAASSCAHRGLKHPEEQEDVKSAPRWWWKVLCRLHTQHLTLVLVSWMLTCSCAMAGLAGSFQGTNSQFRPQAAFLTARYMLNSVVELQWNWQYQQCGMSLVEIPQESAGMGIACAATDLTPGLGFSHRCGSKVNSVERVKGALQSLWNFPSFHCTFITTV